MLVAVDDGYAQTKLFGEATSGGTTRFMMRSAVRPGRYGLMKLSGEGSIGSYETDEGEEFTVSEDVAGEKTQFDGFHTSTMNRVLVNHALAAAGYGGQRIELVTGLPVADFFDHNRKNEAKIAAKRENLLKGVRNVNGEALAKIVDVTVGCQALAAFVDYYLDDAFNERDVPVEKVAVVDVGGRTTDVAVILDGAAFDPSRSGTENIGVLNVYEALGQLIRTEFKTRDDYPLAMLDATVRSGRVKLWGKPQEVAHLVDKAIQEQRVKISREIERRLGGASDLDAVLFVGGGSALFRDISSMFLNGQDITDPEFANSRGFFKYARKFGS